MMKRRRYLLIERVATLQTIALERAMSVVNPRFSNILTRKYA